MKLKYAFCSVLAVMFLLAGCSGKSAGTTGEPQVEIDPLEAAASIYENVDFQDSLIAADGDVLQGYYALDNDTGVYAAYISGSGATAEEIAVFQAAEGEDAEALRSVLESRVENLKLGFENYRPDEMQKLENPLIEVRGNTAYLVLCDDRDQAKKAVDALYE